MIKLRVFASVVFAGFLAACSEPKTSTTPSNSVWTLAADESGMTYVTIKDNLLGETNTFREMSGRVSPNGDAVINIDLNSVDTNNEIRDGRMKEFLFKTESYPNARITTQIDMKPYAGLAIGESRAELLELIVDLGGTALDYDANVLVTRLSAAKVVVATKAPLLLDATDFELEAGLAKLQELAGLESITPIVPVTVSFVFEQK